MSEREDLWLAGIHCKHKPMPNGELRTSMTTPDGVKISFTEAPVWNISEAFPWQPAHFHKGLVETYQLVSGWMQIIWVQDYVCQAFLSEPGKTVVLPAGAMHIVLLGPGAKIITTSFGTPVPNPDKSGNDWWDADADFFEKIAVEIRLTDQAIHQL